MNQHFTIGFKPSGRGKAQCAPNPDYPTGIAVDCSDGKTPACLVDLPYPAPECGAWIVRCARCSMSVAVTVAGRLDDPISVNMACKDKTPTTDNGGSSTSATAESGEMDARQGTGTHDEIPPSTTPGLQTIVWLISLAIAVATLIWAVFNVHERLPLVMLGTGQLMGITNLTPLRESSILES